jgi:hypothetical protein
LIGTAMAAVSQMASTIKSGFCATAWLNFCTWVPASIDVRSLILMPVEDSCAPKTWL